jgi:protein arginine kinase
MKNENVFFQKFSDEKLWDQDKESICLASTLKLSRNIESYAFPSKLNEEKRVQVLDILKTTVLDVEDLKKSSFVYANDLEPLEKEFLFEHFFCMEAFQQAHKGEGFVLDPQGKFLGILNVRDHLQLHFIDYQGKLEKSWNKLSEIEESLSKRLKFSFHRKFGYLTSDINHSGTGLSCVVFAHVPALNQSGELKKFLSLNSSEFVCVRSLLGETEGFVGDCLVVSNPFKTAISEEDLIGEIRRFVTKLEVAEKIARRSLKERPSVSVLDSVSRAFGFLNYCCSLGTLEAIEAISLLKLASNLGWISGVTESELAQWMLNCKKGHLLVKQENQESLSDITRAEWIKKKLLPCTLKLPSN